MSVGKIRVARRGKKIDWILLSVYLTLVILGCATVYSVNIGDQSLDEMDSLWASPAGKQIIWAGISLVVMGIIQLISAKFWKQFSYPIYGLSIILLVLVLFLGTEIKGATSWFSFGSFAFQPSEVAKFATCLALASYLDNYGIDLKKNKFLGVAITLVAIPILFILLQPDAGSAIIFLSFVVLFYRAGMSPVYIYMASAAGFLLLLSLAVDDYIYVILGLISVANLFLLTQLKKNKFYWILSAIIITVVSFFFLNIEGDDNSRNFILLSNFILFGIIGVYHYVGKKRRLVIWLTAALVLSSSISYSTNYAFNNFLEDHQKERLYMWLRPDKCDPSGPLYNLIQSKLAIGSGGIQGKGMFQGTLTKLDYVPEQSTDFIFCAIGEEHGFIGSFVLISLFFLFFMRIVQIAERQKSDFSRYYAYGVVGLLFFHFFINLGMTMGLMPIIGIPLPFISKGGSSLLGFTIMIAVLINLDSRRYSI